MEMIWKRHRYKKIQLHNDTPELSESSVRACFFICAKKEELSKPMPFFHGK